MEKYLVITTHPYEHLYFVRRFKTKEGAMEYAQGKKKFFLKEFKGDKYALDTLKITVAEVIGDV